MAEVAVGALVEAAVPEVVGAMAVAATAVVMVVQWEQDTAQV
jgi:hypothetical protein